VAARSARKLLFGPPFPFPPPSSSFNRLSSGCHGKHLERSFDFSLPPPFFSLPSFFFPLPLAAFVFPAGNLARSGLGTPRLLSFLPFLFLSSLGGAERPLRRAILKTFPCILFSLSFLFFFPKGRSTKRKTTLTLKVEADELSCSPFFPPLPLPSFFPPPPLPPSVDGDADRKKARPGEALAVGYISSFLFFSFFPRVR